MQPSVRGVCGGSEVGRGLILVWREAKGVQSEVLV